MISTNVRRDDLGINLEVLYRETAKESKREKRISINSVVLGLFLCISMITKLITTVIVFDNNIVVLVGILLLVSFFTNFRFNISKKFLWVLFGIAIWFSSSMVLSVFNVTAVSYTWNYFLNFLFYGVSGMLLCSVPLDYEKVLKTISYVLIPYTAYLVIVHIPQIIAVGYLTEAMDISYTLLIGICAVFLIWKKLSKVAKYFYAILLSIGIYYIFFLSSCRGAVLALGVFILILYMSKKEYNFFRMFSICVIVAFVIFSWDTIFEALYRWFPDAGWIRRIIHSQDITSGRDEIFVKAIDLIINNFLFGIGIGGFESYMDGSYTHNIFLQLFCELGVPLGIIVSAILLLWIIQSILCKEKGREHEFLVFLICQFIPRLLLSSIHWMNSFIWIFVFLKISQKRGEKTEH